VPTHRHTAGACACLPYGAAAHCQPDCHCRSTSCLYCCATSSPHCWRLRSPSLRRCCSLSVPLSLQIHILPQLLCQLIATLLAPALAFLTALPLIVGSTVSADPHPASTAVPPHRHTAGACARLPYGAAAHCQPHVRRITAAGVGTSRGGACALPTVLFACCIQEYAARGRHVAKMMHTACLCLTVFVDYKSLYFFLSLGYVAFRTLTMHWPQSLCVCVYVCVHALREYLCVCVNVVCVYVIKQAVNRPSQGVSTEKVPTVH